VSEDQPPPSPYRPAPVTQQAPQNGPAVAALIAGIIGALTGLISVLFTGANPVLLWVAGLLAVIALVLGFVGFGRAQRGDAANATMALWGIITGVIAMVLLVVGLLIQTGVFADGSEEPSVQTETTTTPTAEAPTAETSTPTASEETAPTEGENIYMGDLEVGDCLAESSEAETFTVTTVPCSEPHSHEVFASVDLPEGDGEFPGYQAIDAEAEQLCIAQFEGFVGLPYEQSELKIRFMTPSEQSWLAGDRVVYCAVYDTAGEVSGSLRGAER
jgi:Septum formation